MAEINELVSKLEARVQDVEFPITPEEYLDEIESNILGLGYEDPTTLPKKLESVVILMSQVNFYYTLAGKHAKNFRVRVEGEMEMHPQQVAENYLKLAMTMEDKLETELMRKSDTMEVIESTRWRVSDNRLVPRSTGGDYQ